MIIRSCQNKNNSSGSCGAGNNRNLFLSVQKKDTFLGAQLSSAAQLPQPKLLLGFSKGQQEKWGKSTKNSTLEWGKTFPRTEQLPAPSWGIKHCPFPENAAFPSGGVPALPMDPGGIQAPSLEPGASTAGREGNQ